jgi:predicted O-methyltransferase YrrM
MTDLIDPALDAYLLQHVTPADQLLRDLADETRAATGGASRMQISHDEGAFLTMLTQLTGAKAHASRQANRVRHQRRVDGDRPEILVSCGR